MNRFAQRLALGIAWFFATLTLVEFLPIGKIAPAISRFFLGEKGLKSNWVYFILFLVIASGILLASMLYIHRFVRDAKSSDEREEGGVVPFLVILVVLEAAFLLVPRLIDKGMWSWEWYFRLASFLVLTYLLVKAVFFHREQISLRGLFDWSVLGIAWGVFTSLMVLLFFAVCSSGSEGTLRHFFFQAVSGRFEAKVVVSIFWLLALTLTAFLVSDSAIWSIFKKELKLFFTTPIAYAVIAIFTFLSGLFFSRALNQYVIFSQMPPTYLQFYKERYNISLHLNDIVFQQLFLIFGIILLFLAPVITMRLIAEEKKAKTYEFLMTSPISSFEIVVAKFLSALFQLNFIVAITFIYPLVLGILHPGAIEWSSILTGYLGLFLLCSAFAGIGLFFSSISEDQIVAASLSFGLLMLLWIVQMLAPIVELEWMRETVKYLALFNHLHSFSRGLIVSSDVIYYVSFALFGVFLAHQAVESQRWK